MESTIIQRLREGKFTLIAEIGVNYYDIAATRGISNMDAAKLMIKEAKSAGKGALIGFCVNLVISIIYAIAVGVLMGNYYY